MASSTSRRISSSPSATATTTTSPIGRRADHSARSPSRQSGPVLYRRRLLFLLNAETTPEFPFCEEAYQARSRIHWPPWPHRLDSGHPKVYLIMYTVPRPVSLR
jgi:hypothetical protein